MGYVTAISREKSLRYTFLYSSKEKSLEQRRRNSNADLVVLLKPSGTLQGPDKPKKWTMAEFHKEVRKAEADVPRFFKQLEIAAMHGGHEKGSEVAIVFDVTSLGSTWYCMAEAEQGINEVSCLREDKANLLVRPHIW